MIRFELRHPRGATDHLYGVGALEAGLAAIAPALSGRGLFVLSSRPVLGLHGERLARAGAVPFGCQCRQHAGDFAFGTERHDRAEPPGRRRAPEPVDRRPREPPPDIQQILGDGDDGETLRRAGDAQGRTDQEIVTEVALQFTHLPGQLRLAGAGDP